MSERTIDRVRAVVTRVRERAGFEVLAVTLALVPVIAAFVRSRTKHWLPIGDNALVEIRARDVFTTDHFPLLGTWSSASLSAGKDLNHPGPLLFDLLAVPVRVLGGPAGVALGVTLINALAIVGIAVAARRVGGRTTCLVATSVAATLSWSVGSELLIDPWNPHVLILPCLCLFVLAWGVGCGDLALLPWMLFTGTLCLQTHVGYAYLVPSVSLLALAGAAAVYTRRWREHHTCRQGDLTRMRRWGLIGVVTLIVLWAQPLWEQFTGSGEGNLSRLLSSTGGDEPAVGLGLGTRILATIVALPPWWGRSSFMGAVPYTRYGTGGALLDPEGVPGTAVSVVALLVLVGLLALCMVAAQRRRDRPAFVAAALAAGLLLIAVLTLIVMPIGVLGLTVHQMRWIWALGAFVAIVLLVNLARASALASPRAKTVVPWVAIALTATVVGLNLPTHIHLAGPASAPEAQAPSRELSRQIDEYDAPAGGVLFQTQGLRFAEPYSTVVMSALQRNGVDFYVDEEGLVRQLGEGRRFDGTAATRLYLVEGRPALEVPAGSTRVAFASPLSDAEIETLRAGEAEIAARIAATGLTLTPEGEARVDSGELGVTLEEVDAAEFNAEALVESAAVARLVLAGVLELPPEDVDLFRTTTDLRWRVTLTTVALLAQPIAG